MQLPYSLAADFLKRDQSQRCRIAVVGDCMVDEYYYTDVRRISPEFPIPVALSEDDRPYHALPGGAANVAYQFRNFNVDVKLVALVNEYAKSVYDAAGLDTTYSHPCNHQVPLKRRFYHGDFPLGRWDIEKVRDLSGLAAYLQVPFVDVIIFSDYNKGLFHTDWFREYLKWPVITVVDPKGADIEKWRGCTIFKPNAEEAERLSGRKTWQEQCEYFMTKLGCRTVVITQGGSGVVGVAEGGFFEYRPRVSGDVNSVIGAGDCFIAFLAMGVERGFSIPEAAQVAFEAGALYVRNKHNEPITPHCLRRRADPVLAKFVTPESLKDRKYKLVFTNGCFDILHIGHVESLRFAKSKGDRLVVAVNTDESVRRLKGESRPVNDLETRMRMLGALDLVDYVVPFGEDTPLEVVKKIMPDVIVKSPPYTREATVGADLVPEFYQSPLVEGVSTTELINRIRT